MDKCLNPQCGKPLVHLEGRKPKSYCSNACRQKHWQIKQKPAVVKIAVEVWEATQKEIAMLRDQIAKLEARLKFQVVCKPKKITTEEILSIPKPDRLDGEGVIAYRLRILEMMEKHKSDDI